MAQQKNKSKKEEKKEETVKDVTVPAKVDKFNVEKFREPDVKKEVLDAQLKLKGSVLKLKYLYIIGLVILAIMFMTNKPARDKVTSMFEGVKKRSLSQKTEVSGVYSWKKRHNQYGFNPDQRTGGPFDVVITENNDTNFYFYTITDTGRSYFYGKKISDEIIEGTWKQLNPRAGGKFRLERSLNDPKLYKGIETSLQLPEGLISELVLY